MIHLGASEFALNPRLAQAISKGQRKVPKGTSIFQEGDVFDGVALVVDGWLSTEKSFETGETQLIDFGLPGDVLEPATANGRTAGFSAKAITAAQVCIMPTAVWRDLLAADTTIADAVGHLKAAERARLSERILRLGKGSAQMRIAYALLELCVRLDALRRDPDQSFHVPLTQSMIGDFTGLSTVHVCRMMGQFVNEGIIDTDDHLDIHIADLTRLSEIAGITAEHLTQEIRPEPTTALAT